MRNISVVSAAIANAIKTCNGQRITQEAAKTAMGEIAAKSDPADLVDNLSVMLNLSALNQDLERAGLVKTERTLSALMAGVKAALAS